MLYIIHRINSQNELYHYGVKGMKWGVRRNKNELKYNKHSITASVSRSLKGKKTKTGVVISLVSDHASDQASKRKVSSKEIIDALSNPLMIKDRNADQKGRRSQRYIGKSATVNINPDTGVITTVWPTGTSVKRRYLNGGK